MAYLQQIDYNELIYVVDRLCTLLQPQIRDNLLRVKTKLASCFSKIKNNQILYIVNYHHVVSTLENKQMLYKVNDHHLFPTLNNDQII